MEVFKNFLILKFKRDIIRTKIWFPSGKRWLANNMTGRVDTRLCKLESGWRLVKWMYQVLLSSLSSQRSNNNNNKKIMPDLRLGWPQRWSFVRHIPDRGPCDVMWCDFLCLTSSDVELFSNWNGDFIQWHKHACSRGTSEIPLTPEDSICSAPITETRILTDKQYWNI